MNPKTVCITGASGKVGAALVRYFLARGDSVIATCRSDASSRQLEADHGHHGSRFTSFQIDLTASDGVPHLASMIAERGCAPDCLINNARSTAHLAIEPDGLVARHNFMNELLLDVIVPYELTMALATEAESKLRSVVNIGSMYGTVAANPSLYSDYSRQSPIHYGVAKAAVSHLTTELAVRLAHRGIRVNCVALGGIEGRVDEAFRARYASLCPSGRMLNVSEVVEPIEMLLSEGASGITGHTLAVDGGWSLW